MPSAEDYEDATVLQRLVDNGASHTVMVVDHFSYSYVDNFPGTDHWPAFVITVAPDTLPFDTTNPSQGLTGHTKAQPPLTLTIRNDRILDVTCPGQWTIVAPNTNAIPTNWLESIFDRPDAIEVLRVPVIIRFDDPQGRQSVNQVLNVHPWSYASPKDARPLQ